VNELRKNLHRPNKLPAFVLALGMILASIEGNAGTEEVGPRIVRQPFVTGKVVVLDLGSHFVTTIRMPEAVSSVVVGDPTLFKVEHSDKEPRLVFVKPLTTEPVHSNLLVSTTGGRNCSFLLRARHEERPPEDETLQTNPIYPVDFLIELPPGTGFLIEETSSSSSLISETLSASPADGGPPANNGQGGSVGRRTAQAAIGKLDLLLEQQTKNSLPSLEGRHFRVAVSRVHEEGSQVFVLFSVVNQSRQNLELLPPQIQLAGTLHRRKLSVSSEQLPVAQYILRPGKLRPKERANGVVQFERPLFKQSNQTYLLQIAESEAVDLPVLIPLHLGRSNGPNQELGQ
jgi:hypothetical protein